MRLPNGFGSVHKISGNRRKPYRVRITVGWKNTNENIKKQEYKTIGYFTTKEEGLIALANFNNNPYMLGNEKITFKELYDNWSKEYYLKIVPSSKRVWIAAYNHSKALYNKSFKSLKVFDLENTINNANVGAPTKIRMKCLYNMLYKYAIKHEIIDKNYAIYCETPSEETKIERIPFSDTEIDILWQNIDIPFVDMVLVNIYSGLRPSELVNMKNKNIDLQNKIMIGGMKTNSGKNRKIPIHKIIEELIIKRYNYKHENLFIREDGKNMTYNDYRRRFIKIMDRLNMKHRPHDARHTFITKAKFYKVDEYILKIIVGHKIDDVTENVYTHRTEVDLLKEINKIKK